MSAKEKEGVNKIDTKGHSSSAQRRPSTGHSHASGTTSSSSSSFSPLRVILLLLSALAIYISTQGFFSGESTLYQSSSSSPTSSSSSKHRHRSGDAQIKFGMPSQQLFSSNSASSGQQEQRKKNQQRRQQRRQDPFADFFDHQEEPEAQGHEEACPGYVCSEGGACVETPIQCPCPYEMDTKCFQGDWYVCHRGEHTC